MAEIENFKLPRILAGPIIRRSDSTAINIWICTSEKMNLGVRIYKGRACLPREIRQNCVAEINHETESYSDFRESNSYLDQASDFPRNLQIIGEGISEPVVAGSKIFFNLISAVPSPISGSNYPRGEEISYELFVLDEDLSFDAEQPLLSEDDRAQVTLDGSPIDSPSFALQSDHPDDLRLAFGSCRKLHANTPDMTGELFAGYFDDIPIAMINQIIGLDRGTLAPIAMKSSKLRKINKRPNALFLLGDQIYADDVSSLLLPFLREFASVSSEVLPRTGDWFADELLFQPGVRQNLSYQAGLTSNDAKNHVFMLGEFFGLYIAAWSGLLIPSEKQITDILKEKDISLSAYERASNRFNQGKPATFENYSFSEFTQPPKNPTDALSVSRKHFPLNPMDKDFLNDKASLKSEIHELRNALSEVSTLSEAKRNSGHLRRIMANTPTYMLLDDHEVTDDFNITREWESAVRQNDLGSRVVLNGLLSYWLFQGWGNTPILDQKNDKTIVEIQSYLYARTTTPNHLVDLKCYDNMRNTAAWNFVAPTNPPAVFVDCRMFRAPTIWREYYIKSNFWSTEKKSKYWIWDIPHYGQSIETHTPIFISSERLTSVVVDLEQILSAQKNRNEESSGEIIICCPAPVFDAGVTELLKMVTKKGKQLVDGSSREEFMKVEQEAWSMNPYGVEKVVDFIWSMREKTNINKFTLLSGDVHYSFAKKVILEKSNQKIDLLCLTSSGIKNPAAPHLIADISQEIANSYSSKGIEFWHNNSAIDGDTKLFIEDEKSDEHTFLFSVSSEFLPIPKLVTSSYGYRTKDVRMDSGIKETVWRDGSFGIWTNKNKGFLL